MNLKCHFYGNTTDLYTKVLERTPVLYSKGQLSRKILQRQQRMSDSLTSDDYTQPHSYGDIPVLPTHSPQLQLAPR
jgi:hypothetical protein